MRRLDSSSASPARRRGTALLLALGLALLPAAAIAAKPLKPPTASEQMKFGVQMARRGLWSEALFRFQQADKLDPNNAKTLNNLAVAYEAVGQFENALEYYKKALQAAPGNGDLKKNYARFVEFYQGFKPEGSESDEASPEGDDNSGTGRA